MPPKAAVEAAAQAAAARTQVLADLRELFKNDKKPLSAEEYKALIPRHTEGPYWSAEDEEELQARGKYAHIIQMGSAVWEKETGARVLWRLFPQVYRCLPTDLFSWDNQVDVDTSSNFAWREGSGPDAGHPKPIWSANFCNKLGAFTMHGFWTYNKDWDFPVMSQLMQLAVICRRNDCRLHMWRLVNNTGDTFFTELANEIQREDAGVRSIKDLIDSVEAQMDARKVRPSQFRVLCNDIVTKCFRPGNPPLTTGTPGPYKVNAGDLQNLVDVLDHASSVIGRVGYNMSGEQWVKLVEEARGHIGKHQPPPQPTEGDLLARALAFGFMARERDEIIAGREPQIESPDPFADLEDQPAVPPRPPRQAVRHEEAMEVDEGDGAFLPREEPAADGGDEAFVPMGDPAAVEDVEIEDDEDDEQAKLKEKRRLDREAVDLWLARTDARKKARENREPSPTRGRGSRGRLYYCPAEMPDPNRIETPEEIQARIQASVDAGKEREIGLANLRALIERTNAETERTRETRERENEARRRERREQEERERGE